MTDYRRMEWQYRANRIATWVAFLCILATAEEVAHAFRYHFPWYDDVAMVVTTVLGAASYFVRKHTNIYRQAVDE